jgi:hypothetical protein
MKYFDEKWIDGELDDDEYETRIKEYQCDLQLLCKKSDLITEIVSEKINLHDAVLFSIQRTKEEILLHLLFGDMDIGYYRAIFKFKDIECINSFFIDKPVIILYEEYLLLSSGTYQLSLINSEKKEMCIRFSCVEISIFRSDKNEYLDKINMTRD